MSKYYSKFVSLFREILKNYEKNEVGGLRGCDPPKKLISCIGKHTHTRSYVTLSLVIKKEMRLNLVKIEIICLCLSSSLIYSRESRPIEKCDAESTVFDVFSKFLSFHNNFLTKTGFHCTFKGNFNTKTFTMYPILYIF